jgi:hypothetical protein
MIIVFAFSTISQALNNFTITNVGKISAYVVAKSGSAKDIQTAISQVVALGGKGDVHIPAGTFNFVNVTESWTPVNVPAGVNILADVPPTMDSAWNGRFPLTCHTVLTLPYDIQSGPITTVTKIWFTITGNGDPTKPTRFSGIELQGYRSVNNASVQILRGIAISQVMNFRVDHCIFENIALGISADGGTGAKCRGVFDHNKFVNTVGYCDPGGYDLLTVGYGIHPVMLNSRYWDTDITNIMGEYTDYSIYVEDNYFSRWRHCISSASGAHTVFRYNVIDQDYADGSVDVHGQALSYEGGRCLEIYGNIFQNAMVQGGWDYNGTWHNNQGSVNNFRAINFRGGAGVIFNNTVDSSYAYLASLTPDEPQNYPSPNPGGKAHDLYIWSNSGKTTLATDSNVILNTDYFLNAPTTFTYTPYVYPHPLVSNNP